MIPYIGSAVNGAAGIAREKHSPTMCEFQSSIPSTSKVPVYSSSFNFSGSCDGRSGASY